MNLMCNQSTPGRRWFPAFSLPVYLPDMRRFIPVGLAALALSVHPAAPATAQTLEDLTATPERAATLFLRSVRAIRWRAAAQFIHPEALRHFKELVTLIADADTTGALRRYLTDTSDATALASLAPATVFERAVGRTIDSLPGLMHSLYDHDDHVLGHVLEGTDTAHVVYRTVERLGGAVPDVQVMQAARTSHGWRILWSDQLAVLEEAVRGVTRAVKPPGSPLATNRLPATSKKVTGQAPGTGWVSPP
jgi:hypothetical protein